MSLSLNMDFQLNTTLENLWTAITDSDKLAKWIATNDFKPEVGHHFQFRHQPSEWWDGVVNGEVLTVDKPNKLSYVWGAGQEKQTVVLTLEGVGDGKVTLHLDQTGFSNQQGLEGAKYGWGSWIGELEKLLA